MKKVKQFVFGLSLFLAGTMQSQVSVNINIGSPPQWGPVGYTEVRYYYIPDVEAYYDVQSSMFIYFGDGVWIHRSSLPYRYRNYDLYGGYKVVMTDYRGNAPYDNFKEYKRKYSKGYHGGSQRTIGEKPGKGNYNKRMSPKQHSDKQGNKNMDRNENHSVKSRGNNKSGKTKHGHGGGHGKRK